MENRLKLSKRRFKGFIINRNVSGEGLKGAPYYIKGNVVFSARKTILKDLKYYLVIEKHEDALGGVALRNCANIKFIDCRFNFVFLYKCHHVEFINCDFQFVHLSLSYMCSFSNCSIKKFRASESKGNSFKDCKLSLNGSRSIMSSNKSFRNTTIFLLVGIIGFGSTLPLYNNLLQSSPLLIGILVFSMLILAIVVLSFIPNILASHKIKRFENNIIK